MKLSDFLFEQLSTFGITQAFSVTGGAAMHLNDSLGANNAIDVLYMHHEQACAMAAEAYFRVSGSPAIVCVTAGPGFLNALTGIAGAFTDSIPMIVVAGQVKTETLSDTRPGLRQLGDQEIRTLDVVRSVSKMALRIDPARASEQITEAFDAAVSGRPGPVVLEVPLDIQAADVPEPPRALRKPGLHVFAEKKPSTVEVDHLLERLSLARRPLIMAGSGVAISDTRLQLREFVEAAQVPIVTAWMHDVFETGHPLYAGRAGTIGTRPGNFAVQAADFLLVLGSRLNIRQTGYTFSEFARNAEIFWIDIDEHEVGKDHLTIEHRVVGDLRGWLPALTSRVGQKPLEPRRDWLAWVQWMRRMEPSPDDYPKREGGINPYHLVFELNKLLKPNTVVACGDATACIVPFQLIEIRDGIRLFSNSGIASMGFDLPAAIGSSLASDGPVVCLAGDGSIMMNMQELATLSAQESDIAVLILDNGGYLSIRQTQENFFQRAFGSGPQSGISFPDFRKVAAAFDIPVHSLETGTDWKAELARFLESSGPRVCVVTLDPAQEFEPRIKSRKEGNTIVSPPLDDMHPFIGSDRLEGIRLAAQGQLSLESLEELMREAN